MYEMHVSYPDPESHPIWILNVKVFLAPTAAMLII